MRKQLDNASPARLYATLVGGTLVIAGIIGFFYNGHFGSGADAFGNDHSVEVFGILAVNGWHNLFHIATGLIGLAVAGYAARQYALAVGLLYVVLALWGFILGSGHNLLGIIPINTEDNFLHLLLGLLGLGAGAATEERPRRPARQRTA
jgi:Domain of unknown function (DUF4383)